MVNWIRNLKKIRNEKNKKINLGCVHLSLSLFKIYIHTHWHTCMRLMMHGAYAWIWFERDVAKGWKRLFGMMERRDGAGWRANLSTKKKALWSTKVGKKGGKKRKKKHFFFIPVALIILWEFHIPTTFFTWVVPICCTLAAASNWIEWIHKLVLN